MTGSKVSTYSDLAELNACYDQLQALVKSLAFYLTSQAETWRSLEIQRAELNRQIITKLAIVEVQDTAELVAIVPAERPVV